MANRKWAAAVLALVSMPIVAIAEINLPDLPEPYNTTINPAQIFDALRQGMLANAYELTIDLAIQTIRQQLFTEKGIAVNLKKLAELLASILNNPATSDQQKADDIFTTIDNSLEPYQSTPTGSLNLSLRHTIEYGATRLEWNRKTKYDSCNGALCQTSCDIYAGEMICSYYCTYWTDYVTREPDYFLYRNVSGVEKLIVKLPGSRIVQRNSFGIGPDIGTDILNAYRYYERIPKFPIQNGQAMWYDIHADYRNKGETLTYRVVANDLSTKYGNCGNSHNYSTVVTADADGDGLMDYIPADAYAKYFGKYYGWLIPLLSNVLE